MRRQTVLLGLFLTSLPLLSAGLWLACRYTPEPAGAAAPPGLTHAAWLPETPERAQWRLDRTHDELRALAVAFGEHVRLDPALPRPFDFASAVPAYLFGYAADPDHSPLVAFSQVTEPVNGGQASLSLVGAWVYAGEGVPFTDGPRPGAQGYLELQAACRGGWPGSARGFLFLAEATAYVEGFGAQSQTHCWAFGWQPSVSSEPTRAAHWLRGPPAGARPTY